MINIKIYLVDNYNSGHHRIYQKSLNQINNTIIKNIVTKFTSIRKNLLKGFNDRRKFLNSIKTNDKLNIVHLLYIDSVYKCPMISVILNNKKNRYIGTLHWVPNSKLNRLMLKSFARKLEYVIVHSEYLMQDLNNIGIQNVKCIYYPSFLKEVNSKKINKNEEIIITCLGGTRSDKGLDILIDAFKYIKEDIKNKIKFNIVGIEQDIKYKDILQVSNKYNIKITTKNKFLTDEEYEKEIIESDVILLPYKKIFTGNSGPMTDGVFANKFILGPNEGNLGFLIDKYDLGLTFKQENPEDLADKISKLTYISLTKNHKYREELKIEKFIEMHKALYKEIENSME